MQLREASGSHDARVHPVERMKVIMTKNNTSTVSDVNLIELRDITEYADKFHHDINPAWATEHISDNELLTYVKKVLNFVKNGDV